MVPMGLYRTIVKPALFQLDPEAAHEGVMRLLRRGLVKAPAFQHPALRQSLFGVTFPNPLGLAAGFDKNCVGLNHWHDLGFGFVECGTITFHAQPGNPKPRLFRLPKDEALINRMGFNNDGARAISTRIASARPRIPLGINLGKSKVTPLEEAASDYAESYRLLHRFGAYFVINVSSPNTPGLRDLQEKSQLREIIGAIKEIDPTRPLFVKVSPDLSTSALDQVIEVAHETGLTGLISTNTTTGRAGVSTLTEEGGGLSGRPLRNLAIQCLRHLYTSCDKSMILIGVGGIMNGDDLFDRIRSGAHLCQIYTGWVYGGTKMVPSSLRRLIELLTQHGYADLAEARGTALG